MFISFIIVNYNSDDLLQKCVRSIISIVKLPFEIVICDNRSTDDSCAFIEHMNDRRVILIKSDKNLGFAKGNNLAVASSKGDLLHFINPDAMLDPSIDEDYQEISTGSKTYKMVFVNDIRDEFNKPSNNRYLIPTFANVLKYIFQQNANYWYLGASVIIYKDFFDEIGGWPEDYFMYSEDMDLFYTIYLHNGTVTELDGIVKHIGKGTTKNVWSEFDRLIKVETSNRKFYKKYNIFWQYCLFVPVFFLYKLLKNNKPFLYLRTVYHTSKNER